MWICKYISGEALKPSHHPYQTPCNQWPHTNTCIFILLASKNISDYRRPGHCTLNKSKTKQLSEMRSKNLQKDCWKNQSWPLYPQLQLQSILLLECHGLFSLFFTWTCPLRGGRIVWVHGRGHCLPTCISIRATTTVLETLVGPRTLWIKTCWLHRQLSAIRWKRGNFWMAPCGCTMSGENVLPWAGHVRTNGVRKCF